MITTIRTEDNQLLLMYEYYDCKIEKYCPTTYPIYCLSNDEAVKIKDRLLPQYDDLGTAKK